MRPAARFGEKIATLRFHVVRRIGGLGGAGLPLIDVML
jgi:hypothetical protein